MVIFRRLASEKSFFPTAIAKAKKIPYISMMLGKWPRMTAENVVSLGKRFTSDLPKSRVEASGQASATGTNCSTYLVNAGHWLIGSLLQTFLEQPLRPPWPPRWALVAIADMRTSTAKIFISQDCRTEWFLQVMKGVFIVFWKV